MLCVIGALRYPSGKSQRKKHVLLTCYLRSMGSARTSGLNLLCIDNACEYMYVCEYIYIYHICIYIYIHTNTFIVHGCIYGPPWALMSRALIGRAIMGQALMGLPPWALMGQALLAGPLWAGP